MLSKSTQIIHKIILFAALLCVLATSTACGSTPKRASSEKAASEIAAEPEQPAQSSARDEAASETVSETASEAVPEEASETPSGEDVLISSVFESSGAKTEYALGEAFDETGLSLTLQYSSGKTDTITSGFSSDLDTASAGERDVHIQYQGEEVGLLHVRVLCGPDWTQIYQQFLTSYAEKLSDISFADQYALYDITGDGDPELFLAQQTSSDPAFSDYFVYTIDGDAVSLLGQVPGSGFSLCPADGCDFLAVMRHMFCETVILYSYENGALHEKTLIYEVPVEKLPKDASTSFDELGYHSFTAFKTYSLDDLSGLSEAGISGSSNQALVELLQAEASLS